MASCSSCGVGVGESVHFCPVCGAHLDTDGLDAPFPGFDQPLGLDQVVTTTIEPNRSVPNWLGIAGGVALVGALGWMLTRTPADAGTVEQSVVPTTVAQPTTSQDTDASDRSILSAGSPGTTVPLDNGYHMSIPRGPLRSGEPATAVGVAPGGPLLGQPVGTSLFLGGRRLLEIDLDSGAVTRYGVEGVPVFADRQWLVLQDDQTSLVVLPRSNLAAEPRPLFTNGWVQAVLPDGEGQVWVLSLPIDPLSPPIPKWTSVALSDGSVRASIQLSDAFVFGQTPTVTGTVSGGVFVLEADRQSYRRIADGSPLVPTDRFVLVRRCASPVDCSNFWLDRSSGRQVDRFVPPLDTIWTLSASASGSFVASKGADGWSLWDIERGVLVESLPFIDRGDTSATFSADGRLAAVATTHSANRGEVVIHDALTGTRTLVALPQSTFASSTMTFAPTL